MANLDDLNYKSVTKMELSEGLSLILSIRESRRRHKSEPKPTKVIKQKKAKAIPEISAEQAERLLKLLNAVGGE